MGTHTWKNNNDEHNLENGPDKCEESSDDTDFDNSEIRSRTNISAYTHRETHNDNDMKNRHDKEDPKNINE